MTRRHPQNRTGLTAIHNLDYTSIMRSLTCTCGAQVWCPEMPPALHPLIDVPFHCLNCGTEYAHQTILEQGERKKFCQLCGNLLHLNAFHKHAKSSASFRSGLQPQCKTCKTNYVNPTLNPLRTRAQHTDAAQTRTLYTKLSGEKPIDKHAVFQRFNGHCFHCHTNLTGQPYICDHTLPVSHLWPRTTANATLLCIPCNNAKHGHWPAQVYSTEQLAQLTELTGIPTTILSGQPILNPDAVAQIIADPTQFIAQTCAGNLKLALKILNLINRLTDTPIPLNQIDFPFTL